MSWELEWTARAIRDLQQLDRQVAHRVREAVRRFAATELGDVKRLQARDREWRLRVGAVRVLFVYDHARNTLSVVRVLPRGRAYRD